MERCLRHNELWYDCKWTICRWLFTSIKRGWVQETDDRQWEVWILEVLGSNDCYNWLWKNCLIALHGQYQGKEEDATVTLKTITDGRLRKWHTVFSLWGVLNEISVAYASSLLNTIASTECPPSPEHKIYGNVWNKPYWMVDLIYLKWPIFQYTMCDPKNGRKGYWKIPVSKMRNVWQNFGVVEAKCTRLLFLRGSGLLTLWQKWCVA